jgi:hypothetical protein
MFLPPQVNPQRDLQRAAEETKSLGLCMIGLGVLGGTCLMGNLRLFTGGDAYMLSLVISCGAFGIFYVYAARMMRAGRAWAPTAILAVTGAQAMWVVGYLGWNALLGRARVIGTLALPSALWLAALGVVAFYAVRSARAIRLLALDGPRGFEVPQTVVPLEEIKPPVPSPSGLRRAQSSRRRLG